MRHGGLTPWCGQNVIARLLGHAAPPRAPLARAALQAAGVQAAQRHRQELPQPRHLGVGRALLPRDCLRRAGLHRLRRGHVLRERAAALLGVAPGVSTPSSPATIYISRALEDRARGQGGGHGDRHGNTRGKGYGVSTECSSAWAGGKAPRRVKRPRLSQSR